MISTYCSTSIVGRGIAADVIAVKTYNPRDFCLDKYRKVDDTPYGGGVGMVLKPEPFFAAFESIEREAASPVILTTPEGVTFKQEHAQAFSEQRDITLFCGHYEGFDERIRTLATMELSLGDFVLTGGELPSLAVIDATARLVPGVVGKHLSVFEESFADGLLEGPAYTKPPEFRGMEVPEILRGGNHKEITRWRRREALKRTLERRPDLLTTAKLNAEDLAFLRTLGFTP